MIHSFKGTKAEFVGGALDGKVVDGSQFPIGTTVVTKGYNSLSGLNEVTFYKTMLNPNDKNGTGYPILHMIQKVVRYDQNDPEMEDFDDEYNDDCTCEEED